MKLWSRGLGRTEVSMDFRHYKVVKDKETGDVCIIGNMREPVNWEFRMVMEPDDIPGFMKMAFNLSIIRLVIKNAFKYVTYLFKRKQYEEEGVDLEEKVMKAYNTLMQRSARPTRGAAGRRDQSKQAAETTQAAA